MNENCNKTDKTNNNDKDKALLWKEVSREELYKTVVFTVTNRHSVSSTGLEGDYIVNEARDWVIVIPVHKDNFLMVKQWRHGTSHLDIEFPGGVIDDGEDSQHAAIRELKEETGAVAGKITKLGQFSPNPALFSNTVHIYLAEDLSFTGKQELDQDEYVNFMEIPQKEVIKNMGNEDYHHGLMCSAMGLYIRERLLKM